MPRPRPTPRSDPGTIGAFEAKTHLAELLEQVTEGASFTITRRGIPVARLIPVGGASARVPEKLLHAFRSFQDAHPLQGVTTRQLIDEGRRR